MEFISITFGLFLIIGMIVYYLIPKNKQWIWLLILGMFFYAFASIKLCFFIIMSTITSYGFGLFYDLYSQKENYNKAMFKISLATVILGNVFVMFFLKLSATHPVLFGRISLERFGVLLPIGISFYTLQIVGYCVDVYKGKCAPEKNLLKYALFVTFFPQILQGPIPRFAELSPQFYKKHDFSYQNFAYGFCLIVWGLFLKLVIADRANILVNQIYGNSDLYQGFYVLIAGFLYSMQLYTDFSGCVCIAMGSAQLFDIRIQNNFDHPYFAESISDFWHRWHISLSNWLRDYIYIPLGGNRKGKLRKYINILITFVVSGIWHGVGLQFLLWGLLHGMYQVIGALLMPIRDKAVSIFKINRDSFSHKLWKGFVTFFLVMLAWIIFRANSLTQALIMLKNMFTCFNPWIFTSGELYLLGISEREFDLLWIGLLILLVVSSLQVYFQKKQLLLRDVLFKESLVFRWILLLGCIVAILIFGIYGPGYDATQFIYGGF